MTCTKKCRCYACFLEGQDRARTRRQNIAFAVWVCVAIIVEAIALGLLLGLVAW